MDGKQEDKKRNYRGQSYTIYKGVRGKYGTFRLSPSFPMRDIPMKDRDGFIMLEMAAPKGPNQYDWDNKVLFKLSLNDTAKICMFLSNPGKEYYFCEKNSGNDGTVYNSFQIFHDTSKASGRSGTETKSLKLSKASNKHSVIVQMTHRKDNDTNQIVVPVSPEEAYVIVNLLNQSFGKILSW